jgi:hypothetical protein
MTAESAEILALEGLGWLAGQDEALDRFLQVSGLDPAGLRAAAGSPGTGLAVLEFLLANEPLLLAFCDAAGTTPQAVHAARHRLEGAA